MIKKTKILGFFLLLAAVFISANSGLAQEKFKKTPEERAKHRSEKMTKHLSLSDEQQKQVYDIIYSQATQVDALKNNKDITKESRKEQIKAIFQDSDSKLGNVFNKEQSEKWTKMKEKMKEKHMQKKNMKKGKKHKGNKDKVGIVK